MILKINDRINIRTIKYFNNVDVSLKYDSVGSTFSFGLYYDENNPDHKELACVSHFHEAILEHNGERLLTGYILSEAFNVSPVKELVQFAGYSKPGVLEDCNIPPSLYPLQSDGRTLRQIASRLIAPFKIKMVVDSAVSSLMDIPYETTTADIGQTIKDYLTELAVQRNIIISHTPEGDLLFTRAKTGMIPIMHLDTGLVGVSASLVFSGQSLHSEITAVKQADSEGGNAGQATVINPFVPIVYRPRVVVQTSGDDNSTLQVAKNALAAELKDIILTITIDRWEINGKIIRPNNLVSVIAPELYIYKKTNFFIESIKFTGDETKQVAVLTCVLPCVYDGSEPKNVFVSPHKNSA